MPKKNKYIGSLWLACKLLSRANPTQENVESWFRALVVGATEEDIKEANKYLDKLYRESHKEEISAYQREYRKQEKLRILRNAREC